MRTLVTLLALSILQLLCAQGWQWSKHIGGPGNDGARIGGVDVAGSVYVHGYYGVPMPQSSGPDCYFENDTLYGSEDAFIVKYDAAGNMVWLRGCTGPGSVGFSDMVLDTLNGVFYAAGSLQGQITMDTISLVSGISKAFVSKWTLDGACLWVKLISDGPGAASVYAISLSSGGQLMLAGVTGDLLTNQVGGVNLSPGSFLASCDVDGSILWAKQLMTFTPQQTQFIIYELAQLGESVIGYGGAFMTSAQEVIEVDDLVFSGGTGAAIGLVSLDPTDGSAQWLRVMGYPGSGLGRLLPERMAVNQEGSILCVGSWNDMAIFGEDTLIADHSNANAVLLEYDEMGQLNVLQDYRAEDMGSFGFSGLLDMGDGSIVVAASLGGTVNIDGCELTSVGGWKSVIIQLSGGGNCQGAALAWAGSTNSIARSAGGLYMVGYFPDYLFPTGTTVVGSSTYTTHGWWDVILARHDLLTGVPQPMAPEGDRLEIYANPNRGSFRLRLPSSLANEPQLQLRIYDGTGHLVIEQQLRLDEERPRMDVWDVAPGFYMVTVSNGKRTYSGNMVVE